VPINHKKKFIYFHIPRCGGTSLQRHFNFHKPHDFYGARNNGDQVVTLHHLTATGLKQAGLIDDETLESYFKFTIIRDPFNRMASDYIWQKNHDIHNKFSDMSFDEYLQFAERVMNNGLYFEKIHYDHFRPMIMYCVHEGELLVDDILLLEKISQGINRIKDKIGDITLLRKNRSITSYEHLRTPQNIEKAYQLYSHDKALYDNIVALENSI
jgi:hypothetical protein